MRSLTYFTRDRDLPQQRGTALALRAARISGGALCAGEPRAVWDGSVDRRPGRSRAAAESLASMCFASQNPGKACRS